MTTEPTEFAKKYKPWSISKLSVASQCPRKFYLNYVVKKKVDGRESSAILVGKATHSILEYMLHNRDWQAAYTKAIAEHKLTTTEITSIDDFKPDIFTFFTLLDNFQNKNNIEVVISEKKMAMNLKCKPVPFFDNDNAFFRGVTDLILLREDRDCNHAIVLDHKSGRIKALPDYAWQLKGYGLLTKAAYPKITHVKCGVHHLAAPKDSKVLLTPLWNIANIRPDWDRMLEYINLSTMNTHEFDKVQEGWWCRFCDYLTDCPAHNKGCDSGKEESNQEGNTSQPSS